MKQCFGYVRVSTVKQGDGVSIEAQKEAILAFAERNNLTIIEWYEEKETAAKRGRPMFSAMLRELYRRKTVGLVVHKIDRSARNPRDWADIADLSDAGIDIHFVSETLDFRSRGGRLAADIQAVIASDYIRNLRDEVMKGQSGRLKQGYYPFKAPLGYLDNGGGKRKTLDPVRAPLVQEMFRLYASGQYSLRTLRIEMTRRGLTNSAGGPPGKALVEKMLSNPFYAGLIRIKTTGKNYEGNHEPLISVAQFKRVQEVKAGKCGKKVTRHNHLYRGLFRCAFCETAMIPELQKGRVYYRCHTKECATTSVREDRIECQASAVFRSARLSREAISELVNAVSGWIDEMAKDNLTLTKLDDQLAEIAAKQERLTDAMIDRLIDRETYARRNEALSLERKQVEEAGRKAREMTTAPDDVRKFLELAKSYAALYEIATDHEKRELLEYGTSNRTVHGKNLEFSLSDWLEVVPDSHAVVSGAPTRPNSRTSPEIQEMLSKLVAAARHHAVMALLNRDLTTEVSGKSEKTLPGGGEGNLVSTHWPA